MTTFRTAPASELPIRAEVALRIMAIQAAAHRTGPEFFPTDSNMIYALRLADRFLDALDHEVGDEEANAFFARRYVDDEINSKIYNQESHE